MEDLLKQILGEIKDLKSGQQRLEGEVSSMKQEMGTLKEEVSAIKGEVSTIKQEVSTVKQEVSTIKQEVSTVKQEVSTIKQEVSTIKQEVSTIKQEVSTVKQEVSTIKQEMGTKAQQRENTDIIKALLHNQEEFNAQLETLTLNTVTKAMMENFATKEDTNRLEAKFDDLNVRLFNQTAEIRQLKAVK